MKIYRIALFLFICQVAAGLLQGDAGLIGLRQTFNVSAVNNEDIQHAENIKDNLMPDTSASTTDPISGALGWFYRQINNAAQYIFNSAFPIIAAIAWLPLFLMAIGVPGVYAWAVFTITSVVEVIGFIEFVAGREVER